MDLWQFDERSLKKATRGLPNSILKEQAELLSKKTQGVVYGRITNMKFEPGNRTVEYNLATVFEVVVPQLDNYSYTLMILYSRNEKDYPIAITVGSNLIDDADEFRPEYECYGSEDFVQALKAILSREDININITTLYAKAVF